MQRGLGHSYDHIGFIGTGNFCGYLLAVVLAPRLIRRFRPRVVISGGLVLITLALFGLCASHGFFIPFSLYFLVGMGTGFANIPTMALISFWFRSDQRGKAAGLMIAGNGAAIVLAGIRPGTLGLMISIVLYGSAVFAIPAIMAAAVSDYLGLSRAASAFATITIFFAAGQTIGPALAGVIARTSGSFSNAYLMAGAMTATATIFTLFPAPTRPCKERLILRALFSQSKRPALLTTNYAI